MSCGSSRSNMLLVNSRDRLRGIRTAVILTFLCTAGGSAAFAQDEPSRPQAVSPAQLQAAINKLGDLDYATRTNASRVIRRTPATQAVPALLQTVSEHTDGYVR